MMNAFDTTNLTDLFDTYETFQSQSQNDAEDMTRIANRIGENSSFINKLLMYTGLYFCQMLNIIG